MSSQGMTRGVGAAPGGPRRPVRHVLCTLPVLVVLTLLAQLGTSAAWAGPNPAPEPTVQPVVRPTIEQRYLDQPVTWQPCVFDSSVRRLAPAAPQSQCASVVVPMDWREPDAHPDITVAISYTYAAGPSRGLLTANPGGPGTPAREFTAALAIDHPELFSSFDLLGMDPRGFGASERLTCTAPVDELAALPTTPDRRQRTAATRAAEEAGAQLLARSCSTPELAAFVSTQQTVHDLDFVRVLLGYGRINLVGYGYGARLVSAYASTYPEAAGAVILDSAPDWSTNVVDQTAPSTELRRTQLFAWLARHDGVYRFGATPAAVTARYAALRDRLAATGADPSELDVAVLQAVTTEAGMQGAAEHLRRFAAVAASGEATLAPDDVAALAELRRRLAQTEHGALAVARAVAVSAPSEFSVDLGPIGAVVRCNDLAYGDPAAGQAERDRRTRAQPVWGYLDSGGMCGHWPYRSGPRSVPVTGLPPVLMISAAADPLAGLAGAQSAHRRAPSSVLLTVADTGQHGVALSGVSACADRIALDFLLVGALPADTVCAGGPLPLDSVVHPFGAPRGAGLAVAYRPGLSTVNPLLADLWAQAVAQS